MNPFGWLHNPAGETPALPRRSRGSKPKMGWQMALDRSFVELNRNKHLDAIEAALKR
jgi:hypothetical protein